MIRYLLNLLIKFISLIIFLYKFSYTRSLFNKYIYISHPREIQDAETYKKKSKKETLIFEIIIDRKTYGILHIVVLQKYYKT